MHNLIEAYEVFTWENFTFIGKQLSKVDKDNLSGELMGHPAVFQQCMALLALSKKELDEANHELTYLGSFLRKESKENTKIKLTAKDLDDIVFTDSEYREMERKVTEATHKYLMVKGLVTSLEHKKDILVQLSANNRSETKLYS
jgi:hypothetical protein